MNWYYAEQGQQAGPVNDAQLAELLQSGKINANTLVWHEGLPDWMPHHQAMAQTSPPVEGQVPPATAGNQPGQDEVVCAECSRIFPAGETIRFGKASVCAACKPVFLQKLSEGAKINTGELDLARIGSRFAALFLDGLLLGLINFGLNLTLGFAFAITKPAGGQLPTAFLGLQFLLFFINLAIGVSYEGIMIGQYGATLGKMACKIKVVTADGGKVSYARAFGRYFAKMLSAFTCLIGYIIALFDDQKRALHDHICNTRVVNR